MKPEGFPGQLPGPQGAGVGQAAERLALDVTLCLPVVEVSEGGQLCWLLHPLDHLKHRDKVDVIAVGQLVDELDELVLEALVGLEPAGVEVEPERSPVCFVMAVKVMPEQAGKLVPFFDVRT